MRVHRRDFGGVGACRACLCRGWNLGQLLRSHRPQGCGRTCGFGWRIGRQEPFFFFAQGLVGLPLRALVIPCQPVGDGVIEPGLVALLGAQVGPVGDAVMELLLLVFRQAGVVGIQGKPEAF